jgi:HK97 family phage prohead protease
MREGLDQTWRADEFTFEQDSEGHGTLTGPICAYHRPVDSGWVTIEILPGAFSAQLKDPARVKVLWQHDWSEPIGRAVSFDDNTKRLSATARIIDDPKVPTAQKALALMRAGDIDELSVGFRIQKWTEEREGDDVLWKVSRAGLREFSVVTFGAQGRDARVTTVQSEHRATITDTRAALRRLTA